MTVKIETKPERTLWQQVQYGHEYHTGNVELYQMKKGSKHGHMVSSLCDNGLHMPALDIDFRIDCSEEKTLTFWKNISKNSFLTLLQTLAFCEIISEREFHQQSKGTEDFLLHHIIGTLFWFKPIVPVRVKPSTTGGHFHLFIDKPMAWEEYKRLLTALRDAEIIGSNFFNLSIKNQKSFLFLQGQKEKIKFIYVEPM